MRTSETQRPLPSAIPMTHVASCNRTDQANFAPSVAPSIALCLIKSLGIDEAERCAQRHHWDGVLTMVRAEAGHAGACG